MSAFLLKAQLHTFIQSMYSEGMVNEQFLQIHLMKEGTPRQPEYAIRAITRYCLACTPIFSALTQLIDQGEVDFQSVHYLAFDLYARSSSLGAENVRSACAELLQACERKDKNHCSQALYWVKHRFACLRIKVETLVLLERRIIDLEIIR